MKEPLIHSHITDVLPVGRTESIARRYARTRGASIYCDTCNVMVHAFNNECMYTWVETGRGNFCIKCFAKLEDVEILDDEYGLT